MLFIKTKIDENFHMDDFKDAMYTNAHENKQHSMVKLFQFLKMVMKGKNWNNKNQTPDILLTKVVLCNCI